MTKPIRDAEQIEKDGQLWLLLGLGGFFFGFGLLSGPLSWYFGRALRRECHALGLAVPGTVRAAHVIGVVTTILIVVVTAVVVAIFAAVLGDGPLIH